MPSNEVELDIDELSISPDPKIRALLQKLHEKDDELQATQQELKAANNIIKDQKKQLSILHEAQEGGSSADPVVLQRRIDFLVSEVENLKPLEMKLTLARKATASREAEIELLKKRVAEMQESTRSVTPVLEKTRATKNLGRKTLSPSVSSRPQRELEDEILRLKSSEAALKGRAEGLQKRLEEAENDCKMMAEHIQDEAELKEALETSLLEKQALEAEVARLREESISAVETAPDSDETVSNLNRLVESLQNQLADSQRSRESYRQQAEKIQVKLQEAEGAYAGLVASSHATEAELARYTGDAGGAPTVIKFDEHVLETKKVREEMIAIQDRNSELEAQVSALKAQTSMSSAEIQARDMETKNQIVALQDEIDRLQRDREKTMTQLEAGEMMNKEAQQQMEKRIRFAEGRWRKTQDELSSIKMELEREVGLRKQGDSQNGMLQRDLDEARNQIEKFRSAAGMTRIEGEKSAAELRARLAKLEGELKAKSLVADAAGSGAEWTKDDLFAQVTSEITQKQEENAMLTSEKAALQGELDDARRRTAEAQAEVERLKGDIKAVTIMDQQNQQIQQKLLIKEREDHEAEKARISQELYEITEKSAGDKFLVASRSKLLQKTKADLAACEERLAARTQELNQVSSNLSQAARDLTAAQEVIRVKDEEISMLNRGTEERMHMMVEEMKASSDVSQRTSLLRRTSMLEDSLSENSSALQRKSAEVEALKKQLDEERIQRDVMQQEHRIEVKKLERLHATLNEMKDMAVARENQAKDDVERLELRVKDYDALVTQIEEQSIELEAARALLQRKGQEVVNTQGSQNELASRVDQLSQTLLDRERQLDKMRAAREEDEKARQMAEQKQQVAHEELQKVSTQLATIPRYQEDIKRLKGENNDITMRLSMADDEYQEMSRKMRRLISEGEEYVKKIGYLEHEARDLRKEIHDQEMIVVDLKPQLTAALEDAEQSKEQFRRLQEQNKITVRRLDEKEKECAMQSERIGEQDSEIETLKSERHNLQKINTNLQYQLNEATAEALANSRFVQENEHLRQLMRNIEVTIADRNAELHDQRVVLEEKQLKIQELEDQIDDVEDILAGRIRDIRRSNSQSAGDAHLVQRGNDYFENKGGQPASPGDDIMSMSTDVPVEWVAGTVKKYDLSGRPFYTNGVSPVRADNRSALLRSRSQANTSSTTLGASGASYSVPVDPTTTGRSEEAIPPTINTMLEGAGSNRENRSASQISVSHRLSDADTGGDVVPEPAPAPRRRPTEILDLNPEGGTTELTLSNDWQSLHARRTPSPARSSSPQNKSVTAASGPPPPPPPEPSQTQQQQPGSAAGSVIQEQQAAQQWHATQQARPASRQLSRANSVSGSGTWSPHPELAGGNTVLNTPNAALSGPTPPGQTPPPVPDWGRRNTLSALRSMSSIRIQQDDSNAPSAARSQQPSPVGSQGRPAPMVKSKTMADITNENSARRPSKVGFDSRLDAFDSDIISAAPLVPRARK